MTLPNLQPSFQEIDYMMQAQEIQRTAKIDAQRTDEMRATFESKLKHCMPFNQNDSDLGKRQIDCRRSFLSIDDRIDCEQRFIREKIVYKNRPEIRCIDIVTREMAVGQAYKKFNREQEDLRKRS